MGNAFKESGVGVHDRRMRDQHLGGTQVSIQRTQPESSLWTYAKCAKVILSLASRSIFFLFCVYVPCESMCSICMQCSQAQSHQIPWNWSHTWLWASWYAWSSYKLLCNTEDSCVLLIKVCRSRFVLQILAVKSMGSFVFGCATPRSVLSAHCTV